MGEKFKNYTANYLIFLFPKLNSNLNVKAIFKSVGFKNIGEFRILVYWNPPQSKFQASHYFVNFLVTGGC